MPEVTTPTLPVKIHGFRRLLSNRRVLLLSLIWFAGIVGTLPFLFRWPAPPPATGSGLAVRLVLGYSVAAALGYWMYRVEKPRLNRRNAAVLVFFIFLLAAISNQLHRYMVDYGKNAFGSIENTAWQVWLEDSIIQQSPAVAPHVYRFLPNSLVRWMQIGGLDFAHARDLYRLLFGLLLSYALYRYARLFTNYLGALIAMLLTAVVLPVSYQYYVGQLTDPMSHLSFVLAFIFLEKEDFPFLLTTLLIGSLAKESVLAMAGYYLLFGRRGRSYPLKAITLLVACPVIYFAIRLYILRGTLRYADISGVGIQHVMANFFDHRWPYLILLTGCSLMPLLVFGWRNTPDSLRWLPLYLFGALFFSSLFFSWLAESRNYMPMVFVLAVIGGYHLTNWASAGRGTADTPTAAASLRVTRQGRLQAATAGLRNTSAVTATEGAGMRWAIAFSAGVALLVASTLAVIIRTYSPLPKWDHWEEIVWLKSYYAGHWHFSDLLRQHNEHRLLFPRLFLLADWFLFRGRNIFVLLAILILQAGHAWVFIREVRVWKELPIAVRLTIISIVVALFFSGANLDNFSWPFQIQFILPFYAGTVALYALIRYAEQSAEGRIGSAAAGWLAVSAASGFVATYSLASGILIWPVLLVTGSFLRLKARILLLLGGIFGLLAVQYFSGYHQVAGHGSVLVALRHPFGILAYVGSYIALPVAKINRIVGTLVGLAALGGCAWAACRIVRRPLLSRLSVLSLGVMMYITAGAFITAVGRMGIASPEATFRYATPVCIFWVCTLLLAISETEGLRQRSIAIAAVLGTAIAGLVLAIVPLHLDRCFTFLQLAQATRDAETALLADVDARAQISAIYPNPDIVLSLVDVLRDHHRSLFAGNRIAVNQSLPADYHIVERNRCRGVWESTTILESALKPGEAATGWAWDNAANRRPQAVLFLDDTRTIRGVASFTQTREDVAAGLRNGRMASSGWFGFAKPAVARHPYRAYSLLGDKRSLCPIADAAEMPKSVYAVFRNGLWIMDSNRTGVWEPEDRTFGFGLPGDIPVTGDWDGSGVTRAGVFRNGQWYLDWNGNGKWDSGDRQISFGLPGDVPVTGDWNHTGVTKIGIFRNGTWILDWSGRLQYGTASRQFIFGSPGDIPVVGDWDGSGFTRVGVFRRGAWYLDTNGNFQMDNDDRVASFGIPSDQPVTGDWNGLGVTGIGVFRDGQWFVDSNGNMQTDLSDRSGHFGLPGDIAVTWKK